MRWRSAHDVWRKFSLHKFSHKNCVCKLPTRLACMKTKLTHRKKKVFPVKVERSLGPSNIRFIMEKSRKGKWLQVYFEEWECSCERNVQLQPREIRRESNLIPIKFVWLNMWYRQKENDGRQYKIDFAIGISSSRRALSIAYQLQSFVIRVNVIYWETTDSHIMIRCLKTTTSSSSYDNFHQFNLEQYIYDCVWVIHTFSPWSNFETLVLLKLFWCSLHYKFDISIIFLMEEKKHLKRMLDWFKSFTGKNSHSVSIFHRPAALSCIPVAKTPCQNTYKRNSLKKVNGNFHSHLIYLREIRPFCPFKLHERRDEKRNSKKRRREKERSRTSKQRMIHIRQ